MPENKNNTTRQSKQTRRAFVKLDGFALPDAGGFGNSDGENDFMFGLPLLGSGVDAGGADEIELMIDGVEKTRISRRTKCPSFAFCEDFAHSSSI